MAKKKLLSPKQKRFAEEYLIDLNGTQAAIRAGYSPKTANEQAAQNLAKLSIQEFIQTRQKELQKKTGITQERVLAEYARIAFSDTRKLFKDDGTLKEIVDLNDDDAACLAGLEVGELQSMAPDKKGNKIVSSVKKVKIYDKVKALDSLAEHLGMFVKKIDVTSNGQTINPEDLEKLTPAEKLQLLKLKQKMLT